MGCRLFLLLFLWGKKKQKSGAFTMEQSRTVYLVSRMGEGKCPQPGVGASGMVIPALLQLGWQQNQLLQFQLCFEVFQLLSTEIISTTTFFWRGIILALKTLYQKYQCGKCGSVVFLPVCDLLIIEDKLKINSSGKSNPQILSQPQLQHSQSRHSLGSTAAPILKITLSVCIIHVSRGGKKGNN